jgi:predicted MPP superfamily phosphohydrolase
MVPKNEATVLLAHEPDFADYAARHPVDLQLSGHSHGGQVRLPGIGALVLPAMARKYPMGFNRVGRLQVYTNRGLGVINPPVRFRCPPEVTFVTLLRPSVV